jgi:hypothetical protein
MEGILGRLAHELCDANVWSPLSATPLARHGGAPTLGHEASLTYLPFLGVSSLMNWPRLRARPFFVLRKTGVGLGRH